MGKFTLNCFYEPKIYSFMNFLKYMYTNSIYTNFTKKSFLFFKITLTAIKIYYIKRNVNFNEELC